MTPEHKALVATVTKWLDGGCNSWGLPSGEIRKLCVAIESLSTQCAQLQAGEPVAWRRIGEDNVSDVTERSDIADQWERDGIPVTPLCASPQPANPAQVTDAIPAETLRQLDILFARTTQGAWRTYQNGVHPVEVGGMGSGDDYAICTHGPKSFANADWIATMHDEWPRIRAFLSGKEV